MQGRLVGDHGDWKLCTGVVYISQRQIQSRKTVWYEGYGFVVVCSESIFYRFLYMTFWASLGQQRYGQYNMLYAGFWTDLFGLICRVVSGLGQQYGGVSLCRALTCLWIVCRGKQSSNCRLMGCNFPLVLSGFITCLAVFLECSIWIGIAGFYGQQDSRLP
ncbi:unnamed protein product [Vicia faba]|uniref:Uncharacterized protein n=1 Tax=Vicia faba TaxID=3906 RepID=A0AAV1A8I3_VICFA|nr:unnamed protein product [Vicia faba]